MILYLTSRALRGKKDLTEAPGPVQHRLQRGANLPYHRGTATPFFLPRKESFCYIFQEHNLTKNFISIGDPFQNLAMRSKGIIKTCPNFISSTTFKKISNTEFFHFPQNEK